MTYGIRGPDKRVEGSDRSRRIRPNRLNEERADDKLHLAEFEEYVRKEHDEREQRKQDSIELHDDEPSTPQEPPADVVQIHDDPDTSGPQHPVDDPDASGPPDDDPPPSDDPPHLDITV